MSLLQKSQSVELSRRTQPFYAKTQRYSLGQQVQIEIDTQREFLDMESLRIQFELHDTGAAATNKSTNRWTAANCIRNLRVKTLSGQMIGHEQREYRAFAQWKLKHLVHDKDVDTALTDGLNASFIDKLEGSCGGDELGGDTNPGFRKYSHKPMCHIFGVKDYYPAHFHQGLMVEFDTPSSAYQILKYDTAAPVLELKNIRIVVDLVQLKPELENEMVRLMEEQKLFVDYVEWLNQENPITTASTQAYDVVGIDGRVKSAFLFWVEGRAVNGTTDHWGDDGAAGSKQDDNFLSSYRFRLGSRYLNYEGIGVKTPDANDAERIHELAKAFDIHSDMLMGSPFGNIQVLGVGGEGGGVYGIGVKVDKAMNDVDDVISSQVDKDRNNMRVELGFSANPTLADGYTFVVLDKRLQLLPGSIVRNVRS